MAKDDLPPGLVQLNRIFGEENVRPNAGAGQTHYEACVAECSAEAPGPFFRNAQQDAEKALNQFVLAFNAVAPPEYKLDKTQVAIRPENNLSRFMIQLPKQTIEECATEMLGIEPRPPLPAIRRDQVDAQLEQENTERTIRHRFNEVFPQVQWQVKDRYFDPKGAPQRTLMSMRPIANPAFFINHLNHALDLHLPLPEKDKPDRIFIRVSDLEQADMNRLQTNDKVAEALKKPKRQQQGYQRRVRKIDPKNAETRVAGKLLKALQKAMEGLAPNGVEIASHSANHVLVNLTWPADTYDAGQHALNRVWMPISFELGGMQASFFPQGEQSNLVQASMDISLDKLERALDTKGLPGLARGNS